MKYTAKFLPGHYPVILLKCPLTLKQCVIQNTGKTIREIPSYLYSIVHLFFFSFFLYSVLELF